MSDTPNVAASAPESALLHRFEDGVLTLCINRPQSRNALNTEVLQGLNEGIARAETDPQVRAVVITGAGEKAFCAGADLMGGSAFALNPAQPRMPYADLLRRIRNLMVPVVARVNGHCMAGGMGLVAVADIVLAADDVNFGLPESKIGLYPMQVLAALQHAVGKRALTEMCLTGQPVNAQRAMDIGLITRAVPRAELDETVHTVCTQLKAASPSAQRRGKYAMAAIESMEFDQAMRFMEGQIHLMAQTKDAAEGIASFAQKRAPQWTGQ